LTAKNTEHATQYGGSPEALDLITPTGLGASVFDHVMPKPECTVDHVGMCVMVDVPLRRATLKRMGMSFCEGGLYSHVLVMRTHTRAVVSTHHQKERERESAHMWARTRWSRACRWDRTRCTR
jgi:hypothetical protein